jgi:CheY-like chemotaxis protein/two-component sensor histidine kinase
MKGPDEPDQNWGRDVIERQVKHLTRLIDDLLDVSRISTGKVQLKRAPLDVREIVSRSVEAVSSFMTAKQHELRLELPTEPLATHADPARLEQILCNLLTNAAKYTDHGGAISLSGEREGLNIVIRIKDNGVGIAPEKLGRVFSLFTQIDSNLDRPQGGLGMGLTLVKMLVEMHEGRVTATSGGPGLGSEFTITLPALLESTRPASELGPGNSSDLRTSSERPRVCVLVIDDNVDAALGMAMLVQTAGYEVRTVHDGPSALEILRNYQPEFVLIDLGLPGMSSYELAQAFRRERSLVNATLVAISGYGQPKDRDLSRLAGFDYHLIKPIDLETLLPILTSPAGTSRPPR